MSGTLPSVNKPSIGGRAVRGAARGTLSLGSRVFNKMFPTIGRAMAATRTAAEPDSINTSSENVTRNLQRQIGITRRILDNQVEQNRLLERLLLVYKNREQPRGTVLPPPPPAPEPGGAPGTDLPNVPTPDLPDRRQPPRPQPQQQRPQATPQQRPTATSRATSAVRAGARLATRFLAPLAVMAILYEGLHRLGQQSELVSPNRRARLTSTIESLRRNIDDYRRILEQLQGEEDEQKASELVADLEEILTRIRTQRDAISAMAAQLDADVAERARTRREGPRPPPGFSFTQSIAQLVGQASQVIEQAQQAPAVTPEPATPPPALEPATLLQTSAVMSGEIRTVSAARATENPAVRVEGDTIIYDFERIKFEADVIKFDGLSLPTPQAVAAPAGAPPPAVPQTQATAAVPSFGRPQPSTEGAQSTPIGRQPPTASPLVQRMIDERRGGATPNAGSAATAMQFFQSRGWTAAQAAGFAANLQVESNFNPAAVGDGGRAYGIAQWHPDRQAAFQRWSGHDIRGSTFEEQLEFMQFELTQGNERRAGTMIRQATTPEQAAAFIDQYYERSNGHARQRRMQLAASYASNVPVTAGQQPVPTPSSSAPALAQASTERVVADREQMRNTQILLDTFNARLNQRPAQQNEQAAARAEKKQQQAVGEVPLRSRILEAFNYLAQAS